MLRAPVAMLRISTRSMVHIDPHAPHSEGPLELDVLDFIARLTIHIPEARERLVDYYGLYSNASRHRRVSDRRDNKTPACPAEPVGGSMRPDHRRSGDTRQGPHARNRVEPPQPAAQES